jgi:hypothetical protein
MLRHALCPSIIGLLALVFINGCTPGPVRARAEDGTMEADNPGGTDVGVGRRDAAPAAPDAALVPHGAAGAGGASPRTTDAAILTDGSLPETPTEIPKLPRPAPRDGGPADAPPDRPGEVLTARAPRPGEVAIDELLVNPTGDDLGREWLEIANRAAEPLDLSQLHLATASTDVASAAGTIAAGALLLLGQSTDPAKNGGAPVAVTYGTKLILPNANGQLSLCLGACASGVVLDTVSWGTLTDEQTGHALIVDPATKGICVASAPFGTAGSFGTPGAPNPPCVENVDGGSRPDVSVAD